MFTTALLAALKPSHEPFCRALALAFCATPKSGTRLGLMFPDAPAPLPPPVVEFDEPWPALFVTPPPVQVDGAVSPLVLMTGIPVGMARTEADEMRRRTETKNFILVETGIF